MLAALAGLLFIAISYWWLRVDGRGPDNDAARHISYARDYWEAMEDGKPFAWFSAFDRGFAYPPLVHLVGALALLPKAAFDTETMVFGMNLVFVPMLVAGAYGVGSIAGDRRTGVLAVLVALGTPMVMSMFHSFMTDGALTGTVALMAWFVLRSDRFASWQWSAAAGLAAGVGLMTKTPFVFFGAGLVLVVLARGGWRNWRNVLVFAVAAVLVAGPWYIAHFDEITGHTRVVTQLENPAPQRADSPYPERWTVKNFTWYAWNGLNNQVYLPLALLFLVGAGYSVRRLVKGWRARGIRAGPPPSDVTPELLGGFLVGYLGISYLGLDDPRYTLPCAVYFAALATSWLAHVPRRAFTAGAVVVAAIVALNTASVSVGWVPKVDRLTVFESDTDSQIRRGQVTLVGRGYIAGPPDKDIELPSIFSAAHTQGVRYINFGGTYFGSLFLSAGNILVVASEAGLVNGGNLQALGPGEMLFYMSAEPQPGSCSRSEIEDTYVNLRLGDENRRPWYEYPPYCPL